MRNCKSNCLGNRRVLHEHLIYLLGRNLFSAPVNELLKPSRKEKVTVCVQIPLISRPEPAVLEILFVSFRTVRIAGHDSCAADQNLSSFTGRNDIALIIKDGNFNPCWQTY